MAILNELLTFEIKFAVILSPTSAINLIILQIYTFYVLNISMCSCFLYYIFSFACISFACTFWLIFIKSLFILLLVLREVSSCYFN